MSHLLVVCVSVLCVALPAAAEEKNAATAADDLVILNAKIWTVNREQPEAEALAVVRDRIAATGRDCGDRVPDIHEDREYCTGLISAAVADKIDVREESAVTMKQEASS